MSTTISILHLLLGLAVGVALALAHASMTRRAAAALVEHARRGAGGDPENHGASGGLLARQLLGFPVRVGVPGLILFGLATLSLWALAGGVLAFTVGQHLALSRP